MSKILVYKYAQSHHRDHDHNHHKNASTPAFVKLLTITLKTTAI